MELSTRTKRVLFYAPDTDVANKKKCTIIKIKVSNLLKMWNKFAYIEIK